MKNLLFAVMCVTGLLAVAEPAKDPTWTTPEKALAEDPDFSVQGEYGQEAAGGAWGLQVIAMGEGNFEAYALEGGLRRPWRGKRTRPRASLAPGPSNPAIAPRIHRSSSRLPPRYH